ncbi:MAG: DNA-processing protein DprA [bacterium]
MLIKVLKQKDFPALLQEIHDPPRSLYVRGKIPQTKQYIAVVGPRKCSRYAREVVRYLISRLEGYDVTIVSGLALGIDAEAHAEALKAGLPTLAVLGSGIADEFIYPRSNFGLAQEILKSGGALISEYNNEQAHPHYFIARNRIISGLCQNILVAEAPKKSGALITADYALSQNRDVLTFPSKILETSGYGTNQLLKDGAYLITEADDLITKLDFSKKDQKEIPCKFSTVEKSILTALSCESLSLDNLCDKLDLSPEILLSNLTNLELLGKVRNLGNQNYIKV